MSEKEKQSLITELAFKLVLDSEAGEGYNFNEYTIDASGAEKMTNIDKETILDFLSHDDTKVFVEKGNSGHNYLIASNSLANESIKIKGLADHYLALLDMVNEATKVREKIVNGEKPKLLSHELICKTNLALQPIREGEVAIGEYRDVDFLGNKVNVYLNSYIKDVFTPIRSIPLADSSEVYPLMDELINWVNNDAFKDKSRIMHDVAEFHARFIKIHPFRDGNGRTGRLLMNYLLLSQGQSMVTIPLEDKDEYNLALDYANTEGVIEGSKDIENFVEYCERKHIVESKEGFLEYLRERKEGEQSTERQKGKTYKVKERSNSEEKMVEFLHKDRERKDRYRYLTEFLTEHQIELSSEEACGQILNDYGKKNVGEEIKIGTVGADQIEYIPGGED